jgi:adenylyltransferase/sulfurtransferase
MRLEDHERERYGRQLIISGWDEAVQIRLKSSHVFIAGAGGLGSAVISYLAAAGIGAMTICDCDHVELSNLNRQILHGQGDIGKLKIESAGEAIEALNSTLSLRLISDRIESPGMHRHIAPCDLVIDCLDNFPSRLHLNSICVELGKPMVHAGIEGYHGQITFFDVPRTPCLNCITPQGCPEGPVPIVGATAGLFGSLQALEAIKFLSGTGEVLRNSLLFIDARSMSFTRISLSRNVRCELCGIAGDPDTKE